MALCAGDGRGDEGLSTLLEALKKANLVDKDKADALEREKAAAHDEKTVKRDASRKDVVVLP